jgi:putative ABC transport system substrate-binding protein
MTGRMGRTIGGALFSSGAASAAVGPVAAQSIDKIFKSAQPAELPVDGISRSEVVVNLETLGIDIPRSILPRADEVIE